MASTLILSHAKWIDIVFYCVILCCLHEVILSVQVNYVCGMWAWHFAMFTMKRGENATWLDKRKALTNSFFAIIKTEVYIVIGFFWVHTRQFAFSNLSF